jgi:hypothetical protein
MVDGKVVRAGGGCVAGLVEEHDFVMDAMEAVVGRIQE